MSLLRPLVLHASAVGIALLATTMVLSGCPKSSSPNRAPAAGASKAKPVPRPSTKALLASVDLEKLHGLYFVLSEADPEAAARQPSPRAKTEKLSSSDVKAVLARMPAISAKSSDVKAFAFRKRSMAPPRTGETVKANFPPPPPSTARPTDAKPGPLKVLRHQPEGDVAIVPHLSITFSQPMVALTSHDDLAKAGVPVKLTPEPKGHWRWVGTKTLLFEPKPRFPMATAYTVEVPAGTKSALGGVLSETETWTFRTPPPKITQFWPSGSPQRLDVPMFVHFDQAVDPDTVLGKIKVVSRGKRFTLKLLRESDIAKHETMRNLVASAQSGRWVAFKASEPFEKDSPVTVSVGPRVPSAEGPRTSKSRQRRSFRTFAPLRIRKFYCIWRGTLCPPGNPMTIEFNNSLDMDAWNDDFASVDPLPRQKVINSGGRRISIGGITKPRSTYTATVSAEIKDVFGQTLGDTSPMKFMYGGLGKALTTTGGNMFFLEPSENPAVSAYSVNHDKFRVAIYRVKPSDYIAWTEYLQKYSNDKVVPKPPGKRVLSTTMKTQGKQDEMVETKIALRKYLNRAGHGHLIVTVEPMKQRKYRWAHQRMHHWVQSTELALDATLDGQDMFAWVSQLADGAPVSGARVRVVGGFEQADQPTNDAGQSTFQLGSPKSKSGRSILVAQRGDDIAFLPETSGYWRFKTQASNWRKNSPGERLRWHVYDDRAMYKPKETVTLKGFIRRYDAGEGGDVKGFAGAATTVGYEVYGPRGNKVRTGKVDVSQVGGFSLSFDLPDNINLGRGNVRLTTSGGRSGYHTHYFNIQEFRRPEYEVKASAQAGPHVVGGHATATISAKYYTGGGLAEAAVNWNVTQQVTGYRPPNHRKFRFGVYVPWWQRRNNNSGQFTVSNANFKGTTNADGEHQLRVDFPAVKPARATTIRANASVTDVNRQQWASSTTLLVHPADHYVGLKAMRSFYEKGKPIAVDFVVAGLDGKRISGREVVIKAERLQWKRVKGRYQEAGTETQTCKKTSTSDPVRCEFQTPDGGRYRILASVKDTKGRLNESQMTIWVSGGKVRPQRGVSFQPVVLVPDKDTYQPGDTAEILAQSPFPNAEAFFTIRRSGVIETKRFKFKGSSYTLKVPITDAHLPNVHVNVQVIGVAARSNDAGDVDSKLPKRPAYGGGSLSLPVPPDTRVLAVTAKPAVDVVEPAGETTLDVSVKDAAGNPVSGAEVAVVVVDEAVLALSNYRLADPIASFYTYRPPGAADVHSRGYVLLDDPAALASKLANASRKEARESRRSDKSMSRKISVKKSKGAKRRPAPSAPPKAMVEAPEDDGDVAGGEAPGEPGEAGGAIAMRKDFNPLAVFIPQAATGADGRVTVKVKVKDSLTRYRIMVVAADAANKFGTVESAITARLPLMVRPSAPRFLNFGDKFELPIVVQNQTPKPMIVDVAVRVSNAKLTAGAGRRVTVPANDRVEVRIPATTSRPGTARFQVGAVHGRHSDAAEVDLPVWTPATTEAFATYGVVDKKGSLSQPVKMPSEVIKEFGGLEITTSSTAVHALTDALIYLAQYRFECSEQLASKIIGVSALRDVLTAFKSPQLPSKGKMEASVRRSIKMLKTRQHWNGGFGFWKPGQKPWPYVSVYVTHALLSAKAKGYKVPSGVITRAKRYLKRIEQHYPWWYSQQIRWTISSYALNVRNLMGDKDGKKARALVKQAKGVENLSLEAIGWLYPVFHGDSDSTTELAAVKTNLNNRVTETAASAHYVANYADGTHLIMHSSRRADGIILDGLMTNDPKSNLIPKIVRGLMAHRKRGRWLNTQENAFILLAMDRYFNTYEKTTPDFVARVWLGEEYAGEHAFKGRTTERYQIDIPMAQVAAGGGAHDLVLQKDGKGRMYYRLGMRYAPANLRLEPADHGFAVRREYEGVDDARDVVRHKGEWYMKAGSKVRVRVTMVAPTRRYHVAMVDPLPAGLEPINPALAVSGDVPQDPKQQAKGGYWWWNRTWYEHQNMRDERVEAFTSLLWGGVHTYTYVTLATTPGRFVTPPPKAEEMYHPETFGRGATDIVRVVDAIPASVR